MKFAVVAAAGAISLFVPRLPDAQPAEQRAALYRWNDSLLQVQNPGVLQTWQPLADAPSPLDGARREAFVIRRAELTGNHGDLDWIIQRAGFESDVDRGSAWGPYLLARAYAVMAQSGWEPIRADDGKNIAESYADATWRTLHEAIERDSSLAAARDFFVQLLVPGGDRLLRPDQLAVLGTDVRRPSPDPDALLVWGRHLRTLRQYDSALALFDRSAALGGDPSRLALERARTLRALHDTAAAAEAYWDGLSHLTSAGRELYRYDLAWLVDADSLKAFDAVPDSALSTWMHRFWDQRDAAAANLPGQRLDEHLRRWDVAYARYRVRSPWRRVMYNAIDVFFDNTDCVHRDASLYDLLWKLPPTHAGDLRDDEWLLDNRGIMYLRHGEPIERIGGLGPRLGREDFTSDPLPTTADSTPVWSAWSLGHQVPALVTFFGKPGLVARQSPAGVTESWLYNVDGERLLLNFRGSYALGEYDATTLSSYLPYSPFVWLARSGTLPEYHIAGERIAFEVTHPSPLMNPPTCWNEVRAAIARSRSDATVATHNDSDSPPLIVPWITVTRFFALGTEAAHTSEALITFGLGGNISTQTMPDGTIVYPVHFRVVAWERHTGQTITMDTLRGFALTRPLGDTERLTSWLELPLPAGDWQIAARMTQHGDSAGAIAIDHDVTVDRGNTLALSDVVTGVNGSPEWRATDGALFPVNVLNVWTAGRDVQIYYEVHGLATGARYRTLVDVRPIGKASRQTVRVESEDRATGALTAVRRTLGVATLLPGRYQLTVTVSANGKEAQRTQVLELASAPSRK